MPTNSSETDFKWLHFKIRTCSDLISDDRAISYNLTILSLFIWGF